MDAIREDTMRCMGVTPEGEVEIHMSHLEKQSALKKGRPPKEEEKEERRQMLQRRGILPIPEDVREQNAVRNRDGQQSEIPRPYRGGARLKFGASFSDVAPKLARKRRTAKQHAVGGGHRCEFGSLRSSPAWGSRCYWGSAPSGP